MARFDLSNLPKNTEEMDQYKEQVFAELTADYEKQGMAPVLALLAQATALVAYQANSQLNVNKQLHANTKEMMVLLRDQLDIHKVQTKAISERLEELEGLN